MAANYWVHSRIFVRQNSSGIAHNSMLSLVNFASPKPAEEGPDGFFNRVASFLRHLNLDLHHNKPNAQVVQMMVDHVQLRPHIVRNTMMTYESNLAFLACVFRVLCSWRAVTDY